MTDITIPTRKEIVTLVEAQANSLDSISERFAKVERLVEKQEDRNDKQDSRNRNIIIAVLLALVLLVASATISVIISNKQDKGFYSDLQKSIYEQNLKVQDLNNQISNIKIRNPYLK